MIAGCSTMSSGGVGIGNPAAVAFIRLRHVVPRVFRAASRVSAIKVLEEVYAIHTVIVKR